MLTGNKLLLLGFAIAILFAVLLVFLAFLLIGRLWLRTFLNGVPVSWIRILAMRLRGNPAHLLVDAYIALKQSNVPTSIDEVETVYIQSANRIMSSYDLVELIKKQKIHPE